MSNRTDQQRSASSYVIAEMACSHDGNADLAKRIIDGAGDAGAHAIQFQIWILADMVVAHHPSYSILQSLELSPDTWKELATYTRQRYPAMDIIACVSESSSVELSEDLGAHAYKIHAGDLSNHVLLQQVARTGKRIDLCVGASTQDEIQAALTSIHGAAASEVWLMYGYQVFPTPTHAIHLRYMQTLIDKFGLRVGYQDHSDAEAEAAFYLPAVAMGLGINVQEKHITHDRSAKGADHQSALNPSEFKRFVDMIRDIDKALGLANQREFSAQESEYRRYSKKSLVAARNLPVGHRLEGRDLLAMRADRIGVPPDEGSRLNGRVLRRAISAQHLIAEEDVE